MPPEKPMNKWLVFSLMVGVIAWMLIVIFCLTGCTYAITMVHTEGAASDVVDETATNTPSTSLSVPVSVIPK